MTAGSPIPIVPTTGLEKVSTRTGFVYVSSASTFPQENIQARDTNPDKTIVLRNIIFPLKLFLDIVRLKDIDYFSILMYFGYVCLVSGKKPCSLGYDVLVFRGNDQVARLYIFRPALVNSI